MDLRNFIHLFFTAVAVILLSSCSLNGKIDPLSLKVISSDSLVPVLNVKNFSLVAGSTATIEVDPKSRTITLSKIPAGRIYSLILEEDGSPMGTTTNLSCNSGSWVENLFGTNVQFGTTGPSALHLDLSFRDTDGTINVECYSPVGGAFKLVVNYLGNAHSVLTSSLYTVPGGMRSFGTVADLSGDGNIVVSAAPVGFSTVNQIVARDQRSGKQYLVSSVDGTYNTMSNLDCSEPVISKDGRYVVFSSAATNLVYGGSVKNIYLKDLQDISKAPILISSLDSTKPDQSFYQGNSLSEASLVTADGRYVFFRSTATNFSAGTATLQYFRKDLQNLDLPPLLVSSLDSTKANQSSYKGNAAVAAAEVSDDGRYFFFSSAATNFVTVGSSAKQIYMKDLQNLAVAPVLISSNDSTQANQTTYGSTGNCDFPDVSGDGSKIVFNCISTNFSSVNGYPQVYLKDRLNLNVPPKIISSFDSTQANQSGYESAQGASKAQISNDGRYVVFISNWAYFYEPLFSQTFLKDLQDLSASPVMMSSFDSTQATQANYGFSNSSQSARVNSDGQFILFISSAYNANESAGSRKVYIKNRLALSTKPATLVSSDLTADDQALAFGAGLLGSPAISDDGRYVFYMLSGTMLCKGCGNESQIFRKDMYNLHIPPVVVTSLDSLQADQTNYKGTGTVSPQFGISSNGRYVVFSTTADNFVTSGITTSQIYFKDMDNPSAPPQIISSRDSTQATQTGLASNGSCLYPSISNDGRYVAFTCDGTNFVTGVTSGVAQVYLKDRNNLASPPVIISSRDSTQSDQTSYKANAICANAQISRNGQKIIFISIATNLVTGASSLFQVYAKNIASLASAPIMVSSLDSTQATQTSYRGNDNSYNPSISSDGRYVVFQTSATNFYTTVSGSQIYRKDLNAPTVKPVIVSSKDSSQSVQTAHQSPGAVNAKMSADGRYVTFTSLGTNFGYSGSAQQMYRKDMTSGLTVSPVIISSRDSSQADQTNYAANASHSFPTISGDANYYIFQTAASNLIRGIPGTQIIIKRQPP